MRLLRLLPLAALFLVGACDEEGKVTNTTYPPLAYVRYVNAVPDVGNLDFKFIDDVEYSPPTYNAPFRTVGIYQGARAGSRQVRVFRNSSDITVTQQVLTNATLNLTAGTYYTILHAGYLNTANGTEQSLILLDDTRPAQSLTDVHVSGVNAALNLGAMDFFMTDSATEVLVTPFATGVAAGARSAYGSRATGALAVQAAATTTTVSLAAATSAAGAAGSTLVDPLPGYNIAGTQMSAFFFPASIAGSGAASFTTPGISITTDRQPPRTVPD